VLIDAEIEAVVFVVSQTRFGSMVNGTALSKALKTFPEKKGGVAQI
jgi:hypothetical protein